MKTITGLGHVAIKVKDVERSMAFYKGVLKFPEMLRLHHDDGSLFLIYLRITDTQYLEIFPHAATDRVPGLDANGVNHFCLTAEKLEPLLEAVAANGGSFAQWITTDKAVELIEAKEPSIGNGLDGNRQVGSWTPTATGSSSWKWRQAACSTRRSSVYGPRWRDAWFGVRHSTGRGAISSRDFNRC